MNYFFSLALLCCISAPALWAKCSCSKNDIAPSPIVAQNAVEEMVPQSITTQTNKSFTIELPSTPSTGYSWQLAQPVDKKYIMDVTTKYQAPAKQMPGAAGTDMWTFTTGTQPGNTTIMLEYKKPWEAAVTKRQIINVTIK